jgi:hypothetical protein
MEVRVDDAGTQELRQEGSKFKTSLGYTARLYLKKIF